MTKHEILSSYCWTTILKRAVVRVCGEKCICKYSDICLIVFGLPEMKNIESFKIRVHAFVIIVLCSKYLKTFDDFKITFNNIYANMRTD